jgi:hypothetical protein
MNFTTNVRQQISSNRAAINNNHVYMVIRVDDMQAGVERNAAECLY